MEYFKRFINYSNPDSIRAFVVREVKLGNILDWRGILLLLMSLSELTVGFIMLPTITESCHKHIEIGESVWLYSALPLLLLINSLALTIFVAYMGMQILLGKSIISKTEKLRGK